MTDNKCNYKAIFHIGPEQKRLPEKVQGLNAQEQFAKLPKQEQDRLRRLVIKPLTERIRNLGETTALELLLALGCFLVVHDPENKCSEMYKQEYPNEL